MESKHAKPESPLLPSFEPPLEETHLRERVCFSETVEQREEIRNFQGLFTSSLVSVIGPFDSPPGKILFTQLSLPPVSPHAEFPVLTDWGSLRSYSRINQKPPAFTSWYLHLTTFWNCIWLQNPWGLSHTQPARFNSRTCEVDFALPVRRETFWALSITNRCHWSQ